jgi:ATP-dependent Clp protease ATP-binding subunit ClpA
MQLEAQLEDRNVSIEINEEARTWIGNKGYDKNFGARPLARVVQEHIKKPLAEELLFGKLTSGGLVKIKVKKNSLSFEYKSSPNSSKQTHLRSKNTKNKDVDLKV